MINGRAVALILGLLAVAFGAAMLVPLALDLLTGARGWGAFAGSAAITVVLGGMLAAAGWQGRDIAMGRREGFLLTAIAWFMMAAFGALPFYLMELKIGEGADAKTISYAAAFFESASGLTTTGSTTLDNLQQRSPGTLLWRGLLNFFGGIGIVVMAIALLPFLRVGGMQLFRTESSDKSDKPLPRATQTAVATVLAYVTLVVLAALAFLALGMKPLDAAVHAMAAIATGGFGNYDDSFASFSPAIQWATTLFMLLGGLPLVIYVRMALGSWRTVWQDSQIRAFLALVGIVTLMLGAWLTWRGYTAGDAAWTFWDRLRHAAFNAVSVVTTTGFASDDYNKWGGFAGVIFIALMFIGGCTGSTSGAIKIMRFEILGRLAANVLRRLVFRHGIARLTYQGRPVDEDTVTSVIVFLFVYFLTFAFLTMALAATGLDFLTALTGSAQAIGNVGPGLGDTIGPAGNFVPVNGTPLWVRVVSGPEEQRNVQISTLPDGTSFILVRSAACQGFCAQQWILRCFFQPML